MIPAATAASRRVPWVAVAPQAPYFVTEHGEPWTPIGQNDAITWPDLSGLIRRRDLAGVESHLRWLRAHGVTCLRLMLEYCQHAECYLENPAGMFRAEMVSLWDDLFDLCERYGIYSLLTPFDTFFTWNKWADHPYNRANGGPCAERTRLLTCPETRQLIKARLAFASERWGASGIIFAWDLWNEMHPAQGEDQPGCISDFIDDVGSFLRDFELRLHGRAHLQTASVFGPELKWKPWLREPIFRHPSLDFASVHLYEEGSIDFPLDTVSPALATDRLIRDALHEIHDTRPLLDTEHGPIHNFKDHGRTLPEAFDDEYFRHMQWAHVASGGAGGGMRWPNREPHVLTQGMRKAQRALWGFLPLIDWPRFRRRNLHDHIVVEGVGVAPFACGDDRQVVLWLLRTDSIAENGRLRRDVRSARVGVTVPGLSRGRYRLTCWDTMLGCVTECAELDHGGCGPLAFKPPPIVADLAMSIRRFG
jgi:hypothetical protein